MAEYIEREEAVKTAMTLFAPVNTATQEVIESSLRSRFNSLPAADVVEVRHGRWKKSRIPAPVYGGIEISCSSCGRIAAHEYNYCPNCGARMDGGD